MVDLKKVYLTINEETALAELDNFDEARGSKHYKVAIPGANTGLNYIPISSIQNKLESLSILKKPQKVNFIRNTLLSLKLWILNPIVSIIPCFVLEYLILFYRFRLYNKRLFK